MNLLLTGAVKYSAEQQKELENLNYKITFVQDERVALDIDCSQFDAVVCNGLFLYTPVERFANLKLVQLSSAGLDRAPVDYLKEHNIQLFNARGVYSVPMAEWVMLKALEFYKKASAFYISQKEHLWVKQRDTIEINNKNVCVVGTGSVGIECIKRFSAFGAFTIGVDIYNPNSQYIDEFCHIDNIDCALKKSDIVVLTLPLTEQTKNMFNIGKLALMKDDSVLINVARGGIINESDLITLLNNGKFKGVALDVFEKEPLDEQSPLWDFDNVSITPHNSFVSDNNSKRLFEVIYKNLKSFSEQNS